MTSPLARQIIRDALRVRDRELVWVHTWNHSIDLAHEIVEQAQLHGAAVVLSLANESSINHVLKNAPLEAATTSPRHWLTGISKADVLVFLDGPEDPAMFKPIDKGKVLAAIGQQTQALGIAFSNRVRTLFVRTTGLTEKAAKTYGIDYSKWLQESNRCLSANQAEILDLGRRISILLNKNREIHLSSSEGTDLRFRTRGSPLVDDGVIDQEDIRSRNVLAQLPAGTVAVPVDESSAEGSIIFNWPKAYLGDIIQNLRLDFKKGQITNIRALKGESTIERALRAGIGTKDRLTSLIFGINSNATTSFGQSTDALIPGTLTLGIGDNSFLGGRSQSNFSYQHTLNDAIVSIGPTAVIMDGKLTL